MKLDGTIERRISRGQVAEAGENATGQHPDASVLGILLHGFTQRRQCLLQELLFLGGVLPGEREADELLGVLGFLGVRRLFLRQSGRRQHEQYDQRTESRGKALHGFLRKTGVAGGGGLTIATTDQPLKSGPTLISAPRVRKQAASRPGYPWPLPG
jgi:hypothetical protein